MTMNLTNHQVRLAARPTGLPDASSWELTTESVPAPASSEFVVEVSHLSIDPAMRGWMNHVRSYIPPVEIGAVMRALALGKVAASEHPDFAVGDHVSGAFGVQEFARSDGSRVNEGDPARAPPQTPRRALDNPGIAAYRAPLDVAGV